MDKAKLRTWAKFLRTVPEHKFDMGTWGRPDYREDGFAYMPKVPTCASAACALGWATAIPEFNAAGLELRAPPGARMADVYFGGRSNHKAAMKFFGLSLRQASNVVYGPFNTPKEVAAYITREFLK